MTQHVLPDTQPVTLLTPEGDLRTDSPYYSRISHLTDQHLRQFYRDMTLVRRFDQEATALQRHGELGLWTPSWGQEAAQIGSAHALKRDDYVFPSYREHGVTWVRGIDPVEVLNLYRCRSHDAWDAKAHNVNNQTLVIGSQSLHAVGYAMGLQRDGSVGTGTDEDRAVVAYFGDGATSQGDVSEAMVFAATNMAPVVFFCQNNQWAISVPTQTQSRTPLVWRGAGFGIPSVRVDGNDVLASYAVTAEAMERARSGGGPTFIEAVTYRMGPHTTTDDPTRYRTAEEEASWRERDPILRVRRHLEDLGTSDDFFAEIDHDAAALAEDIRTRTRALPRTELDTLFEHVYASDNPLVNSERQWFEDYQAGFLTDAEDLAHGRSGGSGGQR